MVFSRSAVSMVFNLGATLLVLAGAGCSVAPSHTASSSEQAASLNDKSPLAPFATVRGVDPELGPVQASVGADQSGLPVLDVKIGHGYQATKTRLSLATGAVTVYPGEPNQRDIVTIAAPAAGGNAAAYAAALAPLPAALRAVGATQAAAYVASLL